MYHPDLEASELACETELNVLIINRIECFNYSNEVDEEEKENRPLQ